MLLKYESNNVSWFYLIVLHLKSIDYYYYSTKFEPSLEKLENESLIVAHAHTNGFITGVWILLGHQKVDGFAVTVQRNKKND